MANEENLIPYQKGQSGNPKGRPKGSKNRSTVAKKWLQVEQDLKNPLTSEIETMSQEDLMTLALIKKAREGDTQAYQKLLDSAYGAPVQQVEQTNIELPFFNLDADRNNGSKED
tara:strand:+ start:377 stop:718 length:342 start_codon:yes stop_codon:yes gene_type:complete